MSIKSRLSQLKQKRKASAESELDIQKSTSQDFLIEANRIIAAVKSKIADVDDWYKLNSDIQNDIIKKFLSEEIKDDNFLGINLDGFVSKIYSQVNGYGILDNVLNDEQISKIFVYSTNYISILKNKEITKVPLKFDTENELMGTIKRILSLAKIDFRADRYFYDGRLENGLLFSIVLPPVSKNGITLTIEKTITDNYDFDNLVQANFISYDAANFLLDAQKACKNILITGNHGAGKSILMSALVQKKSYGSRVCCIEDYKTNYGNESHVVSYDISNSNVYKNSLDKIFENIEKQLPDGVFIPDCKEEIAAHVLNLMNNGMKGLVISLYSTTPADAAERFCEEVAACKNFTNEYNIKSKIAKYIDFIVFVDDATKEDKVSIYNISIDDTYKFKTRKTTFEKTIQKKSITSRKTSLKRTLKK